MAPITLQLAQAISKLAFHFVLARFHFTGFEPEFDDIKRFIYHGTGEPRAKIVQEQFVPQLFPDEARLKDWSHFLTAEFNQSVFISRIQLFNGPSLKPWVWRVDLGSTPSRVLSELAKGFRYFYYPERDASGYSGGIEELKAGYRIQTN